MREVEANCLFLQLEISFAYCRGNLFESAQSTFELMFVDWYNGMDIPAVTGQQVISINAGL